MAPLDLCLRCHRDSLRTSNLYSLRFFLKIDNIIETYIKGVRKTQYQREHRQNGKGYH